MKKRETQSLTNQTLNDEIEKKINKRIKNQKDQLKERG